MRLVTHRIWLATGFVAMLALAGLGPILAQGRTGGPPRGSSPDHKARQERPIQLGVSGGNATDIANGYCCSGTLGALVEGNGRQYLLSNSHVLAGDTIASVADADISALGDPVTQAGLVDTFCLVSSADHVANLSTLSSLNVAGPSAVDAALAEVIGGQVDPSGAILEVGTISNVPRAPSLNLGVKKSGRTTGLTTSAINGLNASVTVSYSRECGGASFTSSFSGQIIVNNKGSKFLAAGDSGSLMVENVKTNPRPIGLVYAGSSSIAVANPATDVLEYFSDLFDTAFSFVGVTPPTSLQVEAPSAATSRAIDVQTRNARRLAAVPGAVGHAVGVPENSNAVVIKVYVDEITDRGQQATPRVIEGVPVVLEEVGKIVGLGCNQGR
jgi:hypothetical protein